MRNHMILRAMPAVVYVLVEPPMPDRSKSQRDTLVLQAVVRRGVDNSPPPPRKKLLTIVA
jgi:hypothetical protein